MHLVFAAISFSYSRGRYFSQKQFASGSRNDVLGLVSINPQNTKSGTCYRHSQQVYSAPEGKSCFHSAAIGSMKSYVRSDKNIIRKIIESIKTLFLASDQ